MKYLVISMQWETTPPPKRISWTTKSKISRFFIAKPDTYTTKWNRVVMWKTYNLWSATSWLSTILLSVFARDVDTISVISNWKSKLSLFMIFWPFNWIINFEDRCNFLLGSWTRSVSSNFFGNCKGFSEFLLSIRQVLPCTRSPCPATLCRYEEEGERMPFQQ